MKSNKYSDAARLCLAGACRRGHARVTPRIIAHPWPSSRVECAKWRTITATPTMPHETTTNKEKEEAKTEEKKWLVFLSTNEIELCIWVPYSFLLDPPYRWWREPKKLLKCTRITLYYCRCAQHSNHSVWRWWNCGGDTAAEGGGGDA